MSRTSLHHNHNFLLPSPLQPATNPLLLSTQPPSIPPGGILDDQWWSHNLPYIISNLHLPLFFFSLMHYVAVFLPVVLFLASHVSTIYTHKIPFWLDTYACWYFHMSFILQILAQLFNIIFYFHSIYILFYIYIFYIYNNIYNTYTLKLSKKYKQKEKNRIESPNKVTTLVSIWCSEFSLLFCSKTNTQ